MQPILHPHSPTAPAIQNRQELDAVVENIVQLQLERSDLEGRLEKEIADLRQQYRGPLAEIDRYLQLETCWAEKWAQQNPEAFGDRRSLECTHAVIGFRTTPPRIERASRRITWGEVASRLADLAWGRRYLRQPAPELNKEALLADRAELCAAELKQAGLRVVQEERFYLSPHRCATTTAVELQEAA